MKAKKYTVCNDRSSGLRKVDKQTAPRPLRDIIFNVYNAL